LAITGDLTDPESPKRIKKEESAIGQIERQIYSMEIK
jgi:hypothetical protein